MFKGSDIEFVGLFEASSALLVALHGEQGQAAFTWFFVSTSFQDTPSIFQINFFNHEIAL